MSWTSQRISEYPAFIGSWPRLKGRQEPEFESRHPGDESLGDKCAEFGRRIGLRCMPWEWQTLRGILSLQPPNEWDERLWTHRDATIECTRQQGKTLVIVLLILFHLYVLGTKRIVYTAQRWSTAADVFERVWAVVDRVPSLRKRLAEKPTKGGNRGVIKLTNGAKVEFGPRSQDFGRGYTELDLLINDEAYAVIAAEEANLTGAQSAAQNPQTIYMSTPPVLTVHPYCQILANMHRLGHAGAPDLFYQLFAAPRGASPDDPQTWALAQPSYGVATNEREIRSKLQKARSADQKAIFNADYLGWGEYPPPETDYASPISEDAWRVGYDTAPTLHGPRVVTLSRSVDRRLWVIGAGQRNGGRVHVEYGYSRMASDDEVLAAILELVTMWDPAALLINRRSAALELLAKLNAAGIEPVVLNATQEAAAAGGFLNATGSAGVSHSDQPLLNIAVAGATKHELAGGRFVWELDPHLDAVTLAHYGLLMFGKPPKGLPAEPVSERSQAVCDETDVMDMAF